MVAGKPAKTSLLPPGGKRSNACLSVTQIVFDSFEFDFADGLVIFSFSPLFPRYRVSPVWAAVKRFIPCPLGATANRRGAALEGGLVNHGQPDPCAELRLDECDR